jgi:hypothetical protein
MSRDKVFPIEVLEGLKVQRASNLLVNMAVI